MPRPSPILALAAAACASAISLPAQQTSCPDKPTRALAIRLCEQLDSKFNAADAAGYLGLFRPIHHSLHADLQQMIRMVLRKGCTLQRRTKLLKFEARESLGIALVDCETWRTDLPQDTACGRMISRYYLVMTHDEQGPFARLLLPVNGKILDLMQGGVMACPPCNYRIGGHPEWLAVPARTDRAGCMESLTYVSLHHDLSLEFSVHIEHPAHPAAKALAEYINILRQDGGLQITDQQPTRAWSIPAYQKQERGQPKQLLGASTSLSFARARSDNPRKVQLYLATFGPLRYLLALRGTPNAFVAAKKDVEALLASFHLLDHASDANEVGQKALQTYTGQGELKGTHYRNRNHRLSITGPKNWRPVIKAGGYLFLLCFTCPEGKDRISFRALAPMHGLCAWNRESAESLIQETLNAAQLRIEFVGKWQKADKASRLTWRDYVAVPRETDQTEVPASERRHLRIALQSDVLVLMEGRTTKAERLPQIRAAMNSLRRLAK